MATTLAEPPTSGSKQQDPHKGHKVTSKTDYVPKRFGLKYTTPPTIGILLDSDSSE